MRLDRSGLALVTTLFALVVLGAVALLIFSRTLSEIRQSRNNLAIVQTLMLARGAANTGEILLATEIRDRLRQEVRRHASTTGAWAFGSGSGEEPDPISLAEALVPVAEALQATVDAELCGLNPAPEGSGGRARLRIHFLAKACDEDLPSGVRLPPPRFVEGSARTGSGVSFRQVYALPFILVAEGKLGPYRRNIVAQGEFRFVLGRASFAQYALFTNVHALPSGTSVWFTDRTLFDGPVHTNQYFRFYRQPWFGGLVTSAGCLNPGDTSCLGRVRPGARFYGEGFVRDSEMTPSPTRPSYTNPYGTHEPQLTGGVDWRASFIPLPINNQEQRAAAQAAGLYFDAHLADLNLYTETVGETLYQRIDVRVCTRYRRGRCRAYRLERYRYTADLRLEKWQDGEWVTARPRFNGVIFSEGRILSLRGPERSNPDDPDTAGPALASFAQITVAATRTIRITGDLKYQDRPCSVPPRRNEDGNVQPAVCENLDAINVLGVYSQDGNVLIARNAPRNLNIDGVLMSGRGVVQVEDYDRIPPRGSVYLTGGIIEYYYGAFGTFNATTGRMVSGYGRRFTFDRRMARGLAPPFFPTTQLADVQSISIYSFGQREQVY